MDDDVLERARRAAGELDGRWFADFEEVCSFAEVLVEMDVLTVRRDVVDFFRRPWRFGAEHDCPPALRRRTRAHPPAARTAPTH